MEVEEKQVKSKARVADHGEVFTAEREVNAMLDLVKHETERIDSRFLEPACGTGNFLFEILQRKLKVVKERYRKNQTDYERYMLLAISSIYGIDLLKDNIEECRLRLLNLAKSEYKSVVKTKYREEFITSLVYVLEQNMIQGDALTFKRVDGSDEPIIFAEWSFVDSLHIQRRDYSFEDLHKTQFGADAGLFSDLGNEAIIPTPKKVYPLAHYMKLVQDA